MSRRHSHSKRRYSEFDREPKRYRRDGKQDRDRDRDRGNQANEDHHMDMDWDQRDDRWLHDALPLEASLAHRSNQQPAAVNEDSDKKPRDHSSEPTGLPRPPSYFLGGWWKDLKDQHNERMEKTSHSREQRDEKSKGKLDDGFERREGFPERKDDPAPTMRKRPVFREKKIPVDSGHANPAATGAVKSSQGDHPPERNEKREERSSNPSYLDKPAKQFAEDGAPNKNGARRDGFSLRVRYGGSGGNGNYKGSDKPNGRQGYRPSKIRIEKWKHDLYQEVNKDPIPKNEDDQIAKLEALLAS